MPGHDCGGEARLGTPFSRSCGSGDVARAGVMVDVLRSRKRNMRTRRSRPGLNLRNATLFISVYLLPAYAVL